MKVMQEASLDPSKISLLPPEASHYKDARFHLRESNPEVHQEEGWAVFDASSNCIMEILSIKGKSDQSKWPPAHKESCAN